jgi:ubiquinone biosynthesis protein COQ9
MNMTSAISNKQAKRNRRLQALSRRLDRRNRAAGILAPTVPQNAPESNLARSGGILARLARLFLRLARLPGTRETI